MQAFKDIRKLMEKQPGGDRARVLSSLIAALGSEDPYPLTELYVLDLETFDLALALLRDWRLDRYYTKKAVLLALSTEVLREHQP